MAEKIYAEGVMKIALNEEGTKENPAGSNKVKYNTWFYNRAVSGSSYPWCLVFVNWCFNKAGGAKLFYDGKKCAGTQTLHAWFKSAKQKDRIVKNTEGRYGDIVLFTFGADHVHHAGLIIKKNSDGTYQCIEGNTSRSNNDNGGCVMIRTRRVSDIGVIWRPNYSLHKAIKLKEDGTVYKAKDGKNKVLKKYNKKDTVRWLGDCKDGWSKVIIPANGEIGYIKNDKLNYVGLTGYKKATIKVSAAFRKKGSIKAGKLQKKNLAVGTKLTVIQKGKSWTQVKYDGKIGWVATKKIDF